MKIITCIAMVVCTSFVYSKTIILDEKSLEYVQKIKTYKIDVEKWLTKYEKKEYFYVDADIRSSIAFAKSYQTMLQNQIYELSQKVSLGNVVDKKDKEKVKNIISLIREQLEVIKLLSIDEEDSKKVADDLTRADLSIFYPKKKHYTFNN